MNDMSMMEQTASGDKLRGHSAGKKLNNRFSFRDMMMGKYKRSSSRSSRTPGIRNYKDIVPKGFSQAQQMQYTPEQMRLFKQMFGDTGRDSYLGKLAGGDQSSFEEMERPAWREFQEAQGQLGSRYSQLAPGALSAQRGSGFQNEANQQSSDFAMNLASKRRDLQRQAIMELQGIGSNLLQQRPMDRAIVENPAKQEKKALGGWGGTIGGVLGGVAGGIGGYFTGMPVQGAMAGAKLGSSIGGGL